MAVITKDDFVGENKKCSYVLAYFKSHHLNVGDEWSISNYIQWIQKKHEEFRSVNHLPECTAYWKGHNENLLERFLQFIGFYS